MIEDLNKKGVLATSDWFEKKFKKPEEENIAAWAKGELPAEFGKANNYTVMTIEDDEGNAVSAMAFTLNDEKEKEIMKIAASDKSPLIYFDLSQTLPQNSGQGLLKMMRTFFLPDLLIKAGFAQQAYFVMP